MMMWFGKRHRGAAWVHTEQTETPVGAVCGYCDEPIRAGEDGWILDGGTVLHLECLLRSIVGSVAHQEKRCSCYGGSGDSESGYGGSGDDREDGMTLRQGARAAMEHFRTHPE